MPEARLGRLSNDQRVFGEFLKEMRVWNTKGPGSYVGMAWALHPQWGTAPESKAYKEEQWKWHQNLGELLNRHATVNVGRQSGRLRLTVSLTHSDLTRLVAVQNVAGGRTKQNPHLTRLFTYEVVDDAAFSVLKCGRLFLNPRNEVMFNLIDAAVSFRRAVPGRGQVRTEAQQAAQEYWREQVENLSRFAGNLRLDDHDCGFDRGQAGKGTWDEGGMG